MTLTDREKFLIIFFESVKLPRRVEWIVENMQSLGIIMDMHEVDEIIHEYSSQQHDILDLVKFRLKQLEKLKN